MTGVQTCALPISPKWSLSDKPFKMADDILKAQRSFSERLEEFRKQYKIYLAMLDKNPELKRTYIKSFR